MPSKGLASCSWEGNGSLRIAMSIDSHIYFANIRLKYDWTFCSTAHTLVYTFMRSDTTERYIMFWNIKHGIVSLVNH